MDSQTVWPSGWGVFEVVEALNKKGGKLHVSNFDEKIIRSWCSLWTSN